MIAPLKKGDFVTHNWRTINEIAAQLNRSSLPDQSRDAGIAGQRQRPKDFATAHPFQIVQSTDWLTYKIVTGKVIITGDPIPVSGLNSDITVDAGASRFWIYVELTTTTATIAASATTPTFSTELIPIGWVDTTDTGNEIGVITQFLHDNIFSPCVTTEAEEEE